MIFSFNLLSREYLILQRGATASFILRRLLSAASTGRPTPALPGSELAEEPSGEGGRVSRFCFCLSSQPSVRGLPCEACGASFESETGAGSTRRRPEKPQCRLKPEAGARAHGAAYGRGGADGTRLRRQGPGPPRRSPRPSSDDPRGLHRGRDAPAGSGRWGGGPSGDSR